MPTMKAALPGDKGEIVIGDEPLGKGGEGSVYTVVSHKLDSLPDASELVAKIYHEPESENRAGKVKAMIMSPPDSDSVAWPLAAIMNASGRFAGYVMQKLDFDHYRPWADLAHAQSRRKTAKDFDVLYAITAVRNFAAALESVHEAGHYIGDINESNMFVGTDARVFLVDTDSAQITDPKTNNVFPCLVGKPEYTAAEISKGSLKNHKRTVETDVFGFAVAAYQMILGGPHPTDGVFKDPDPDLDPPSTIEKIRQGIFPGLDPDNAKKHSLSNPPRVAVKGVPQALQDELFYALSPNPDERPGLAELMEAFDSTVDNLVQCKKVKQHWFDKRDGNCGWCKHSSDVGIDPWTPEQKAPAKKKSSKTTQKALPGVGFGKGDDGNIKAKRAPAQRAGANNASNTGVQASPQQNYSQPTPQAQGQYGGTPQQGYQQAPPPVQREPTQKELRKHFKTSKTVLKYADGHYEPRPPIGTLMRVKPKIAFYCLRQETPDFATFWWEPTRKLAMPGALLAGYVIALVAAVVWWFNFPQWLSMLSDAQDWHWEWIELLWLIFAYVGSIGTAITATWMTISGLWDRRQTKKQFGDLDGIDREHWLKTSLRYVSISIVYGPILVIGTVVGVLILCVNMILALLSNSDENNRRY